MNGIVSSTRVLKIGSLNPDRGRVKLKTVTFVFAVSVVSQHHQGVCTNTGLLRIEIIITVLLNLVLTPQLLGKCIY